MYVVESEFAWFLCTRNVCLRASVHLFIYLFITYYLFIAKFVHLVASFDLLDFHVSIEAPNS